MGILLSLAVSNAANILLDEYEKPKNKEATRTDRVEAANYIYKTMISDIN